MDNSPHNFSKVKRLNFLSSFSESAEKAALKKATKQKKAEKEKDLGVLMWTGRHRPVISVLVTKKIILKGFNSLARRIL